jgi:hypothetical protein
MKDIFTMHLGKGLTGLKNHFLISRVFSQKRCCPKLPAKSETQKCEVFWINRQCMKYVSTMKEENEVQDQD